MIIPPIRPILLFTGANGQLGREFRAWASGQEHYECLFTSRDTLDICRLEDVRVICQKWRPQFIINCAAYTAVDRAETEEDMAYAINSDGIYNLCLGAADIGATIINYSTDYVYHSVLNRPIREDDRCEPKSVYGLSKRAGELILETADINWINIRVSWLYSIYQKNFVTTMLQLANERQSLEIVADQTGSPTYAGHLVRDTIHIVERLLSSSPEDLKGHYNYSNYGQINWADFARLIFAAEGVECQVIDTSTAAYSAPAPRPLWSVMDKGKIISTFDLELPSIDEGLRSCLAHLKARP